jgi:hypothetical protein
MAAEIQETLKEVAAQIKKLVENAATITVETWYVDIEKDEVSIVEESAEGKKTQKAQWREKAHPIAMTEVQFDGDSVAVVPLRKTEDGAFELDKELLELHERNVKAATDYRTGILNSVVGFLREAT